MNQFVNQAQYVLTSELLAEIPRQLLEYMESRNISPKRCGSPHRSGTGTSFSSASSGSINEQIKDRSGSTVGVPLAIHYNQPPPSIPSAPYSYNNNGNNSGQAYPPAALPPSTSIIYIF